MGDSNPARGLVSARVKIASDTSNTGESACGCPDGPTEFWRAPRFTEAFQRKSGARTRAGGLQRRLKRSGKSGARNPWRVSPNAESGKISPSPRKTIHFRHHYLHFLKGWDRLGEQIHVMGSEAAKTDLAEQKSRFLDEFRLQVAGGEVKRCSPDAGPKLIAPKTRVEGLNEGMRAGRGPSMPNGRQKLSKTWKRPAHM